MRFIDRCARGLVTDPMNAVLDEVDAWHDRQESIGKLHRYLGMTHDEYSKWAQNPQYLLTIIKQRASDIT